MKNALLITLALAAALLLPFFVPALSPGKGSIPAETNLPWQIVLSADGRSTVFGLTPGLSTLADAREQLAQSPDIAIIGRRDEAGALEAYFDSVRLGPLTGKMILAVTASDDTLSAMRTRAIKTEHMESTTLRSTLAPDDLAVALTLPIRAIVFIPSARLDADIIAARFGPAAERLKAGDEVEHFLYPAKGLDIALTAKGKAQLQYVAPADFSRVRAPLLAPAGGV